MLAGDLGRGTVSTMPAPLADDRAIHDALSGFRCFCALLVAQDRRTLSWPQAVLSGVPQSAVGDFASFEEQAERARTFTRGMHGLSLGPSRVWPELVDLAGELTLLDVGGGSGAHAIGACLRWPQLRAVVLDLPAVCDVAAEFVAQHGLRARIATRHCDMWADDFPPADVHFYGNVLHDWPPEKNRILLEKSFRSLPPGGRILIHEGLFDDDKSGPPVIAAWSMAMLAWSEGQQYSGLELTELLTDAGFREIRISPTHGLYSLVEARKP